MSLRARVGRRIKGFREARGLSQARLAEEVGLASTTVSRIERGTYGPSWDALERIAEALAVHPAELLMETGESMAGGVDEIPRDVEVLEHRVRAALEALRGR